MATKAALKPFPVEQEYGKKTGITPQDISKLREWLHTQPHLPAEHITGRFNFHKTQARQKGGRRSTLFEPTTYASSLRRVRDNTPRARNVYFLSII